MNNFFAICGLAGVLNAQRELVIAFFAYSAASMVLTFHFLVDIVCDSRIRYGSQVRARKSARRVRGGPLFFLGGGAFEVCALRGARQQTTRR